MESLHKDRWSLHFDGKHLEGQEYQAVVLKNPDSEIKLAVLDLNDGKAKSIGNGISDVIDEYKLWGSINMIVADTTNINTGKQSGVVVRLQRMFNSRGHQAPQFISCQYHVLDRILRLVMDQELRAGKTSPNIEYFFVRNLISNYETLKSKFVNGTDEITDRSGWRDDMRFLYHLTKSYALP